MGRHLRTSLIVIFALVIATEAHPLLLKKLALKKLALVKLAPLLKPNTAPQPVVYQPIRAAPQPIRTHIVRYVVPQPVIRTQVVHYVPVPIRTEVVHVASAPVKQVRDDTTYVQPEPEFLPPPIEPQQPDNKFALVARLAQMKKDFISDQITNVGTFMLLNQNRNSN